MANPDRALDLRQNPVDRTSPIPYYVQIIQALRSLIESHRWPPGFQLPGESELCQAFEVSKAVVRQALGQLVNEGLVVRFRGKGTFVTTPKIGESLVQRLTGFYSDMVERGYSPVTEVLEQGIVAADAKVGGYLQIKEGEPVFKLTRKRSVEGVPIVLVTTYLPMRLCNGLEKEDFQKQSLYETLESRFELFIVTGRRSLEAVLANAHQAKVLEIEEGAPLILLDSISYLEDGTPLEYYRAAHRGDRTRFEVELVRYRETGSTRKPVRPVAVRLQSSVLMSDGETEGGPDDGAFVGGPGGSG